MFLTMPIVILDFFGVFTAIKKAIWQFTYNICVRGPLYIVHGLGDAITYLSGQKVIDLVFSPDGHFFKMPRQFMVFLALAIILIVLFGGFFILQNMIGQDIKSAISGLANRVILILILMLLIPLFFWVINFTVVSIIQIIMPNMIGGKELANMIGRLGFTDGNPHKNWSYDTGYPNIDRYNLFLGCFGSFFCLAIFFLMGLSLIKRLFDLFLLYIVSPVIFATAASSAKWQRVNLWKDLVISRFVSTLGIVLTLTLFMNLEPIMLKAADQVSSLWTGRVAFKLLFLAGGAVACYETEQLFSSLAGDTVGIKNGIGMLTAMKAGTFGLKAGAKGVSSIGRGLLFGKKGISRPNESSLKNGAIAKTAKFVTKATVGSALSTAGFISGSIKNVKTLGVNQTARRAGGHVLKPVSKISSAIKTKVKASYSAGINKTKAKEEKEIMKEKKK